MTLMIELPDETAERARDLAAARGLDLPAFVAAFFAEGVKEVKGVKVAGSVNTLDSEELEELTEAEYQRDLEESAAIIREVLASDRATDIPAAQVRARFEARRDAMITRSL